MAQPTHEGLVRGIRRWDLVAVAINAIIGAGIFGLPSRAFALVGPYSLIAFVVCAIVVALIILCFAEVGSRFDETGGPYLYAREAFGSAVGFEVGWLMWLARLTAFAANCNLLVDYLGFFWGPATTHYWREAIIVLVVSAIAAVNVMGVRDAARVTNVFTVGKLIPIILFIGVGLFFLNSQNYSFAERPAYGAFSSSVLMLIYAFSGFEMAAIPAGEVADRDRRSGSAVHFDSGHLYWNTAGPCDLAKAVGRCERHLSGKGGRRNHFGRSSSLDRRQPERHHTCGLAATFRDVGTRRTSGDYRRNAQEISHAAHFDPDYILCGARAYTGEHVRTAG